MTTETKKDERCPSCGLLYRPLNWLVWREAGYCRPECVPEYRLVALGMKAPPEVPAQASLL